MGGICLQPASEVWIVRGAWRQCAAYCPQHSRLGLQDPRSAGTPNWTLATFEEAQVHLVHCA